MEYEFRITKFDQRRWGIIRLEKDRGLRSEYINFRVANQALINDIALFLEIERVFYSLERGISQGEHETIDNGIGIVTTSRFDIDPNKTIYFKTSANKSSGLSSIQIDEAYCKERGEIRPDNLRRTFFLSNDGTFAATRLVIPHHFGDVIEEYAARINWSSPHFLAPSEADILEFSYFRNLIAPYTSTLTP